MGGFELMRIFGAQDQHAGQAALLEIVKVKPPPQPRFSKPSALVPGKWKPLSIGGLIVALATENNTI